MITKMDKITLNKVMELLKKKQELCEFFKEFNITQLLVMHLIDKGYEYTDSIEKELSISMPAISKVIKNLREVYYIQAKQDNLDGRRLTLKLTKEGKKAFKIKSDLLAKVIETIN